MLPIRKIEVELAGLGVLRIDLRTLRKKTGEDQYGGTRALCFYTLMDSDSSRHSRDFERLHEEPGGQGSPLGPT